MARSSPPKRPPSQLPQLLPYQRRWIEDSSTVKVIEKSRRIGLSWASAAESALVAAASDNAGGMDVWYVGYNREMAKEFIEDVAFWAESYHQAVSEIKEGVIRDSGKDILTYAVRFASGFKVTALSSRPSNLRGKAGYAIIDEAAFHDDLGGLLKAALAFLIWGGRVAVISTHNGDDSEFNALINEIRADKKPYSLHRVTLDDALKDGLYRKICQKTGQEYTTGTEAEFKRNLIDEYGEDADEELFVIPRNAAESYLPRHLVEPCMDPGIPVLRWHCDDDFVHLTLESRRRSAVDWCATFLEPVLDRLDPNLRYGFGMDFGRSGDLSVILPLVQHRDMTVSALCAVELRNVPFKQQISILWHLIDHLPRLHAGAIDANGNGMQLAEETADRYGRHQIHQVMFSQGWYREHMPAYRAAFQDRGIVLPRDADIIDDHRMVKMRDGIASVPRNLRQKGRDGQKRHGDAAIAGVLALFAMRQEGTTADFLPQSSGRPAHPATQGF